MRPTFKEILSAFGRFLLELPIELSSFIVTPIALLFCKKEDEHLPKWLAWYDEPRWGINGDKGWIMSHYPEPTNRTWWARTRWLWRNRINGFQMRVTGLDLITNSLGWREVRGHPHATDQKGEWGLVRIGLTNKKTYFGYFITKKWCKWFYIRIYIGHKLFDISDCPLDKVERRLYESVFTINPFKRFKN